MLNFVPHRWRVFSLVLAMTILIPCSRGLAQQTAAPPSSTPTASDQPRWANRGHWNFGLQVGYGVENAIPRNISHINMLIFQPQLGLIVKDNSLANAAKAMVAEKVTASNKPEGMLCEKCMEKSVVILDGCKTCTSCGWSRCG